MRKFSIVRMFLRLRTKEEKESHAQFLKQQAEQREQARILPILREKYLKYPVMKLTRVEFAKIQRADEFPDGFLETCPIGTLFVCTKKCFTLDISVVGHVVKGDDLFCDQYGAGMCVPSRGINRYRVEIVSGKAV